MDPILINTVSVFLVQIGARFLNFDFTDAQKKIIQHRFTQNLILLALFYASTRNIVLSIGLLIAYNLCLYFLLNEHSRYNIYNRSWLVKEGFLQENEKDKTKAYYDNITNMN